jgi:hypothetical protein
MSSAWGSSLGLYWKLNVFHETQRKKKVFPTKLIFEAVSFPFLVIKTLSLDPELHSAKAWIRIGSVCSDYSEYSSSAYCYWFTFFRVNRAFS